MSHKKKNSEKKIKLLVSNPLFEMRVYPSEHNLIENIIVKFATGFKFGLGWFEKNEEVLIGFTSEENTGLFFFFSR